MFVLSPDETLAALTAAFLGGALFGRIVWRRQAYEGRIRTAADALLRRAEDQFRLVHDSSPDCFVLLHPSLNETGSTDFEFVYLNPAAEQFTGRKPEALIGMLASAALGRAVNPRIAAALGKLTVSGESYRDEFEMEAMHGPRWVALTAVRIDDADRCHALGRHGPEERRSDARGIQCGAGATGERTHDRSSPRRANDIVSWPNTRPT